jgi:ribonuclease HI
MAIATALLTVPENKRVEIHTDSQNCIDTYSKLSTNSPKQTYKRWLKTNNWSVWSIIINTTKGKKTGSYPD